MRMIIPFSLEGGVPLTNVPGAFSRPRPDTTIRFAFDHWLLVSLTGLTSLGHKLLSSMPSTVLVLPDTPHRPVVWVGDYFRCRILLYPRLNSLNEALDQIDPRLTGGRTIRSMVGVNYMDSVVVALFEDHLGKATRSPVIAGRIILDASASQPWSGQPPGRITPGYI